MKPLSITVVVPAYNEERSIGRCLKSIVGRAPAGTEIIVVDNASTDKTAAIAKAYKGVRVVHEKRKGLTRARQCGLTHATGDLVAYVDADSAITDIWFPRIAEAFSDPRLVCLSGPYEYYPGELKPFQVLLLRLFWFGLTPLLARIVGYAVLGGNFVARKTALEAIGGFDQDIAFYGEDTDIARRLHRVGRVKFTGRFHVVSSARRLKADGILRMGWIYGLNFFSEIFFRKPVTREYKDIR